MSPIPDTSDVAKFVGAVVDAFQSKQYMAVAALGIVLVVMLARRVLPMLHDKVGEFVNSDRGAALLTIVVAEAMSVASSLYTGKPTLHALLTGLVQAFMAAGGYTLAKRVFTPSDKAPPSRLSDTLPKPPAVVPVPPPASAARVMALVNVGAVLALLSMGAQCVPKAKAIGIDIAACAVGKVPDVIGPLVPATVKALGGSAVDWTSYESVLIAKGIDVAICAIQAAIAELSKPGMAMSPGARVAIDRAKVSLARLGVH